MSKLMFVTREARLSDIPAMMEIRNNVRENALVHTVIGAADYERAMTTEGRAFVAVRGDELLGFSCGRTQQGDIWALFVRESEERQGIGSALMERVETWMFAQGMEQIWLVTSPNTKAERLYRARGWIDRGLKPSGEREFVLRRDAGAGPSS